MVGWASTIYCTHIQISRRVSTVDMYLFVYPRRGRSRKRYYVNKWVDEQACVIDCDQMSGRCALAGCMSEQPAPCALRPTLTGLNGCHGSRRSCSYISTCVALNLMKHSPCRHVAVTGETRTGQRRRIKMADFILTFSEIVCEYSTLNYTLKLTTHGLYSCKL